MRKLRLPALALAAALCGCFPKPEHEDLTPFIECLRSCTDPDKIAQSIVRLANVREHKALGPLLPLLRHPSSEVRQQTAMALGMLGDKKAREPVFSALKREEAANVRLWLVWAAGELGGQEERGFLDALRLQEKAKEVYGGKQYVDNKMLSTIEKAIKKIDRRLNPRQAAEETK